MDVTLVMFKADGSRRDFPVRKDRIVIGRKHSCGLRIPLSAISREHCEIRLTDDGIIVKDLGSSNGTYHNSLRVQEAELTAGDEVSVGPVVFTVVVDGRPAEIRPVRTVLDPTAQDSGNADAELDDQAVEIADLAIDDDVDLARELSDELASAELLGTPSVDEPPAAGLEDSDMDFGVAGLSEATLDDAGPASSPEPEPEHSKKKTAPAMEDSGLDLDALFADTDASADTAKQKRPASPGNDGSSLFDFDFDALDNL